MTNKTPEQLTLNITILLPPECRQTKTRARVLKETTAWTPLPSIVSEGYLAAHRGINWPHYENMWKLFALEEYFIHGEPTRQQTRDREELTAAIEKVGNAKNKRKHLTAQQIMAKAAKVYMRYGKNVIRAMDEKDPIVSERCLKDLRSEIPDTRNDYNATQLHKVMSKAKTIYMRMQSRYTSNER